MIRRFLLLLAVAVAVAACGGAAQGLAPNTPVTALRDAGKSSDDGEEVGRWALAEQVAPGGDATQAVAALHRLDAIHATGMVASFARALWSEEHGLPANAADAYMAVLVAARKSAERDTSIYAWLAANRVRGLRGSVAGLYARHRAAVKSLLEQPGSLGWRAVAELSDWVESEAYRTAEYKGKAYDAFVVRTSGCLTGLQIAGPFGRGTAPDRRRSFPAEQPGPWPTSWPPDPSRTAPPHVVKAKQTGCLVAGTEETAPGVFYIQGYFDLSADRDVILAVQGGLAVWVDDTQVLSRDLRDWGVWQRFGVSVHLGAGRHRILARTLEDRSAIRVLDLDGRPAPVTSVTDPRSAYRLVPPKLLPDPNALDPMVRAQKASGPAEAYVAAFLAHVEGLDDVASVLIEPYAEPKDAAGTTLEAAASYASSDPAYPQDARHRRERERMLRSAAKDPRLWYARVWLVLDDSEQKGMVDAVEPLRKLADSFRSEPELLEELARVYGKLGWRAERMTALRDLVKRFPDDVRAQRAFLDALDADGSAKEADAVAKRVQSLDADSEVTLDRALAREDWKAAIAELKRIQARRPDRKEMASRIADVLQKAGDPSAAAAELRKALKKNPKDATSRFRLADRAYAAGDDNALRRALAESLQVGASGDDLRDAIDLLEGTTDLEPYRIDGKKVIREFEAWEKKGKKMAGVSARVLDYSALWIHPDGSSQMLEHEILKIQSQEAVGAESEQQPPSGLVLRLRVIKPDGTTLEPEPVAGKPTLTMPNLEVGDYLEIEHVSSTQATGDHGKRYRGPMWLFREQDKGYWRSEFVVISPKDKHLEVETRGGVGAPKMRERGTFVERRWRVDESPPLPEEPDSVPAQEYLPSVRIGWGISLDDTLLRLADLVSDETPLDPRLAAYAQKLVAGVPAKDLATRAKRVYRAVLDNIQDGNEKDGRRVIFGKSGSRQAAFHYLMRELGIPVELALVKNRLALPPIGKMSEVEDYDSLVLRLDLGKQGTRWLTVSDKFAPFGYLPADVRGQPAIRLIKGTPRDTTPAAGIQDGVAFSGRADLAADGSAKVDLSESYSGKLGIRMRNVLDKVPGSQLHTFVESRLLAGTLPGARVRTLKIEHKADLDEPVVVHVTADVPSIARVTGKDVVLKPLFGVHLAQLATLPTRQTPLLLGAASHVETHFDVVAPASLRMPASLPPLDLHNGERVVTVKDAVRGHELHLDRVIDLPAGRVQPGAEYAAFQKFVQQADAALEREIVLGR